MVLCLDPRILLGSTCLTEISEVAGGGGVDSAIVVDCRKVLRTGRRTRSTLVLTLLNSYIFYVSQHDCCGLREGPSDWEKNEEFSCKADGDRKCSVPNSCCTDQKVD